VLRRAHTRSCVKEVVSVLVQIQQDERDARECDVHFIGRCATDWLAISSSGTSAGFLLTVPILYVTAKAEGMGFDRDPFLLETNVQVFCRRRRTTWFYQTSRFRVVKDR